MTADERRQHRIAAIAIGASAGGIEALGQLLPSLPSTLPVPVFIVQHLPRERPSLLVEIYAPRCQLAVREALDKERPEPGTIYFAPPDYHLLVDHGPQLSLSIDEPVHYSRPSIDVLFESVAEVYRGTALGLVLTGGNGDGAAGLAAIQRAGGLTVVEHPDTAQVSMMPAAALRRVIPDFILPLDEVCSLMQSLDYEYVS